MKARMDKYTSDSSGKTRTKRNENLYNEVLDMSIDYVNIDVNNAVELNTISSDKSTREDYQKERELNKILPKNDQRKEITNTAVEPKENRIYDINEILNLAKQNKLFEETNKKRLINTEYNILTKLDIQDLNSEEMKKEDLRSLIDDIYEKEAPKKVKKYSKQEEKELLNDLFEDNNDTNDIDNKPLREELSNEILNKEESSEKVKIFEKEEPLEEQKEIFEEETEDYFIEEKEGKGLVIAIVVVTILIILAALFFVYEYFFGL